jgi:hypothetical protein
VLSALPGSLSKAKAEVMAPPGPLPDRFSNDPPASATKMISALLSASVRITSPSTIANSAAHSKASVASSSRSMRGTIAGYEARPG